jgi:hypothetical protein
MPRPPAKAGSKDKHPRRTKPVDLKDPHFTFVKASRGQRLAFDNFQHHPRDPKDGLWWSTMSTPAGNKGKIIQQWMVPRNIALVIHYLQQMATYNRTEGGSDAIMHSTSSYLGKVVANFRRHTTEQVIPKESANSKTWRSPPDWLPPTLKDCVIRIAGEYTHDAWGRKKYMEACRQRSLNLYTDEQYRK